MTAPRPERCDLSDLLIEHCGCVKHRPDLKPVVVPPDLARRYHTYPLTTIVNAEYRSQCPECKERIQFGESITPQRSEVSNTYNGQWAHEECAREIEAEAAR